jgi:chromosome segregation protein
MGKTKKDLDECEMMRAEIAAEGSSLSQELEATRREQLKLEHARGFRLGALQWVDKLDQVLQFQEKMIELAGREDSGFLETLRRGSEELTDSLSALQRQREEILSESKKGEEDYERVNGRAEEIASRFAKNLDRLVNSRVQREVSNFKLASLGDQLQDLELQLRLSSEELEPLRNQASQLGPPFENPRDLQAITLDLASVQERLRPIAHLSDEVEKMFHNYGELYEGLKKKASIVEQNRAEVLEELRQRFDQWKGVMGKFVEELSERYDSLLEEAGAKGRILVKASRDIDKAGLELEAGFKGNEPVSLDSLTPSGGERTIALIAFLLSLQQFISSPFRAIDEFDVHMDPKNRETVSRLIYAAAKAKDSSQYIAITPGQLSLPAEEQLHVIVVQNVEGSSTVSGLKTS